MTTCLPGSVWFFHLIKQNKTKIDSCNQDGDPACLICEAGREGDRREIEREGGGLPTLNPDYTDVGAPQQQYLEDYSFSISLHGLGLVRCLDVKYSFFFQAHSPQTKKG